MNYSNLRNNIFQSLLNLVTEDGINASGKDEIYGCIFGRDTAITVLKLLKIYNKKETHSILEIDQLRSICRTSLLTLSLLQGQEKNIESGEEPGKFIHEYRKEKYEHLLKRQKPWYIYPDKILRNYDSIDATPLTLIAIYNYWKTTRDSEFLLQVLPSVKNALNWMLTSADKDNDYLVEYEFSPSRKYGGLVVQSWTDSIESLLTVEGKLPDYPIAPVEVQGYVWLALKLWSDFFSEESHIISHGNYFSKKLSSYAKNLKQSFNDKFIFETNNLFFPAQALDKYKNKIKTITGNPLLLLWASYENKGKTLCILNDDYIPHLVKRAFQNDLFDKDAGIRTMSTTSPTYNPRENSYHNGSFWPKLNGMSHEGLFIWKYYEEAEQLRQAALKPIAHFGSPIELYMKDENGHYFEYRNACGQVGCRQQAWSAASALDLLTQ